MPTKPADYIAPILDLLHAHPIITAIVLLVIGVLAGIALMTVILCSNKPFVEVVTTFIKMRSDQSLQGERDQAIAERDAADVALRAITSESELAKLALLVAADAVRRFNRIRFSDDDGDWQSARIHVLDWAQRIFGFAASDINKVTLWAPRPDDKSVLSVYAFNGMSPESAKAARLVIKPNSTADDTFAAMAFRSGEIQICSDTKTDARFHNLGQEPTHPYRSLIAIPVSIGSQTVAVLTIDSLFQGAFDSKDACQLAQLSSALIALMVADPKIPPPALAGG